MEGTVIARLALTIDQGSTFSNEFTVQQDNGNPVDLTGYLVDSQIRKSYRSASITATFVTSLLDPVNGKITMNLPSSVTKTMKAGRYVWDLELTSPGSTDQISALNIGNAGSGYTTATVSFSGGGGTGAAATVIITSGLITGFTITNAGSGYTSDPLVTITGDGTGATATALRGARVERILEGIVTVTPEITR